MTTEDEKGFQCRWHPIRSSLGKHTRSECGEWLRWDLESLTSDPANMRTLMGNLRYDEEVRRAEAVLTMFREGES